MRRRAFLCVLTAVAFLAQSVFGLTLSYAEPKVAVVEVKTGTMTGKICDMSEKRLAGRTVKVLDNTGVVKYSATTGENGTYAIENLVSGTYTLIVADTQKVTLMVKADSRNYIVNAMLPVSSQPYGAGAALGNTSSLIVAIAGGCVLVGALAYGIEATSSSPSYDSGSQKKVSP